MEARAVLRIGDIKRAIAQIRTLLSRRSFEEVEKDTVVRAAFERFLEIVSEASRHVPDAWKAEQPQIPWRRIADVGNVIRHAYDRVDLRILWEIYERDLTALEDGLSAILADHGQKDSAS